MIYRALSMKFKTLAANPYWISLAVLVVLSLITSPATAQKPQVTISDSMQNSVRERALISDVIDSDLALEIEANHSKLLRTRFPIARTSITDPTVLEVTQFGPTDIEIIALKEGSTDLTLWFGAEPNSGTEDILRYRVQVTKPTDARRRRQNEYKELEDMLNEFFPNSSVELVLVADSLVVRGQARDAEEATNILALIRRQVGGANGYAAGSSSSGRDAVVDNGAYGNRGYGSIVNLLRVPGEQQVLLKVRVAELTRTALRDLGVDFSIRKDSGSFSSTFGTAGNLVSLLDNNDVSLILKALSTNGYSKVLAEPNLVTLSGRTASFIAGGQFAVPTAVGIGGVQAASTSFQGFGTQLQFTPTVLDKDRVRLQVAPTLSSLNNGNRVNGIPGLNTRSVYTTVDMREGQWLAIAGLIQDQQEGSRARVPFLGDIPLAGTLFSSKRIQRDETELLILVSPQLVHPLEDNAAPPLLPGMEVTEPNNREFFIAGRIEGNPQDNFRSTVWPNEVADVQRVARDRQSQSQNRHSQRYFLQTQHGFVDDH
jgi:pilus assembly protein CpaC